MMAVIFSIFYLYYLAMEQSITIQNTTKIPCRVKSNVCYYDYNITSNVVESELRM